MMCDPKLISPLKRLYWLITGPAVVIFAGLLVVQNVTGEEPVAAGKALSGIWPGVLFTLAAVTAIAGPILLRVLFAHQVKQNTQAPWAHFLTFQRRLIIVSGITAYIALAAVCGQLSEFHAGGIILMALYGAYYYFPSKKRITHDIKLFRVQLP